MSKSSEFVNNHSISNVFASGRNKKFSFEMNSSKTSNTNATQFEILVLYMTKHPDLSKGYLKTPEARQKSNHQWTNLSNQLNAEGPPQLDSVGWKKVWADFKVHTKAKLRRNKISLSGTGRGPPKYNELTPLEEKVAELLDLGQAIEGMTGSLSFGVVEQNNGNPSHLDNDVTSDLIVENEVRGIENLSGEKENIPPPRITPKKRQITLLEQQVQNQTSYQNNSLEVMKEMNQNLKGILKYKRRDSELKEKIYKIKKVKLELKTEKLQLKKEKFEFKKKSLLKKKTRCCD